MTLAARQWGTLTQAGHSAVGVLSRVGGSGRSPSWSVSGPALSGETP